MQEQEDLKNELRADIDVKIMDFNKLTKVRKDLLLERTKINIKGS